MLGCASCVLRCSFQETVSFCSRNAQRRVFGTENGVISKMMRSRIKEIFRKVHPDLFSYDPKVQVCRWTGFLELNCELTLLVVAGF